jgi:hypothetical protein
MSLKIDSYSYPEIETRIQISKLMYKNTRYFKI